MIVPWVACSALLPFQLALARSRFALSAAFFGQIHCWSLLLDVAFEWNECHGFAMWGVATGFAGWLFTWSSKLNRGGMILGSLSLASGYGICLWDELRDQCPRDGTARMALFAWQVVSCVVCFLMLWIAREERVTASIFIGAPLFSISAAAFEASPLRSVSVVFVVLLHACSSVAEKKRTPQSSAGVEFALEDIEVDGPTDLRRGDDTDPLISTDNGMGTLLNVLGLKHTPSVTVDRDFSPLSVTQENQEDPSPDATALPSSKVPVGIEKRCKIYSLEIVFPLDWDLPAVHARVPEDWSPIRIMREHMPGDKNPNRYHLRMGSTVLPTRSIMEIDMEKMATLFVEEKDT